MPAAPIRNECGQAIFAFLNRIESFRHHDSHRVSYDRKGCQEAQVCQVPKPWHDQLAQRSQEALQIQRLLVRQMQSDCGKAESYGCSGKIIFFNTLSKTVLFNSAEMFLYRNSSKKFAQLVSYNSLRANIDAHYRKLITVKQAYNYSPPL